MSLVRHVAVDGDGVEAVFDGGGERGAELVGGGVEVGEDVGEHGGVRHELRADHAGALGAAEDADGLTAVVLDGGAGDLALGVGGEDGVGEGEEVLGGVAEGGLGGGERGDELFCGERDADDAGGGGDDLVEDDAEVLGDGDAGAPGGFDAGVAGGAVGVAGVDDHGGDTAASGFEMAATDDDGRGDDLIAGEHGRGVGAVVADGEREVRLAAGFDAGGGGSPAEALWKREGGCGGGSGAHQITVASRCGGMRVTATATANADPLRG